MGDAIARYNADIEVDIHYPQVVMRRASDGEWVDYDDHQAEVKRLTEKARLAEMQADQSACVVDEYKAEAERLRKVLRRVLRAAEMPPGTADAVMAALAGEGEERES